MRARYSFSAGLRLLFVGTLLILLAGTASAQPAYEPAFDAEVVVTRTEEGTPQMDVYASVPYPALRFLARTAGFEATYTLTAQLRHVDDAGMPGAVAASRVWDRTLTVADYDATLDAEAADATTQTLRVEPGRYALEVTLEDGASGRASTRQIATVVRPTSGPVGMSDPMLLDAYDAETGRLEPNVGAAISTEQEAFTLYYEVYASAPATLRATYAVTERSRLGDRPSFSALLGLAPRQRADLGVPLVLSEPLELEAGTTPATLRVETEGLQVGEYALSVRLETPEGEVVAEAERPFAVRWMGLDAQIADLDQAIDQLRYVAKDREIAALREAASYDDKVRLFQTFWSRRDPTPGTSRNEQMEEYYYRVAYANEQYSRLRDSGWNTDRGEVFIRFGQPDEVEEHPVNPSARPYEVWRYYRHGRMFIFVDEGVGDYRLVVPIWDERTRM